jgi:hypothetical protein
MSRPLSDRILQLVPAPGAIYRTPASADSPGPRCDNTVYLGTHHCGPNGYTLIQHGESRFFCDHDCLLGTLEAEWRAFLAERDAALWEREEGLAAGPADPPEEDP